MDELARASDICDVMKEWGYDGFMRMEIGFEVVYCDFSVGVDLVTVKRTVLHDDNRAEEHVNLYQWARAVAERYDGIGGDRVRIDFSSMVSGYFFPINISNTDPKRPGLPRLAAAGLASSWRSTCTFIGEVAVASLTYFDAPPLPGDITLMEDKDKNRTAEAVDACTKHYLLPTYLDQDSWNLEDGLIHAAIETVTHGIRTRLFTTRSILLKASSATAPFGSHILRDGDNVCPIDELLLMVMWPIGDPEDYWNPGCRPSDEIVFSRTGYWRPHDEMCDGMNRASAH
ncbi:Uncharacterized protein TPAR_02481 [Tolypocladium paradoxum]|uniref:Uncharacterized protein n=1 Tax=Tolypocladium paradoxum TaxID=94208 RepID=A0A2S4L4G4_9HYPO|nr:Uncharacterized protein TPAR_02481 [Tolypocladium paradoxum]